MDDLILQNKDKLENYIKFLLEYNNKINLIGKSTIEDIWNRHIIDSLQLINIIKNKDIRVADLGSGAGLPGIPLSIVGIKEVHLFEKSIRKCEFLEKAKNFSKNKIIVRNENLYNVKDKTFDRCLYRIINEASDFIRSQLREFTYLHPDGFFKTIPEYPEFAWYEGMVNAIIHRDYSNYGDHITIKLYDDRMEIKSPGTLGGVVTLDNMKYERYSRNPQISRVLAELGIVRELNEGIKRMCREMKEFFLKEPIYSTPNNSSVLLVLDNNIEARSKRKRETLEKKEKINAVWNDLSYQEKKVLQTIYENGSITSMEVAKMIERSKPTAVKVLNKLMEKDLIVWTGTDKRDTYGNYIMK